MPVSKSDLDKYIRDKIKSPDVVPIVDSPDKVHDRLLRVIRRKCIQCSNGMKSEADECPIQDCPLWKYRKGFEE